MMNKATEQQLDFAHSVAIQGVGLIGGSIAAALKKIGFAGPIYGVGRKAERMAEAQKRGLIDEGFTNLKEAAAKADLIIVCTPVDRIVADVREAAAAAAPGTLITDGGSVKGSLCADLATGLPEEVTFIGSHPLAGSEKQGFEHADADLYQNRTCVVTPVDPTPQAQIDRLHQFWQSLGMNVVTMQPTAHDEALAHTSHLPHLVASILAGSLSEDQAVLTASGFRDTTRIAAGDPGLWEAIFLENRAGLLHSLDEFLNLLEEYRTAIENRDATALQNLLKNAKRKRDSLNN